MPKDRFNMSPYHTLPLTLRDQRMLLEVENDLVEDTFRKYEAYVMSNSQINLERWKHVKSKDDLHIYAKKPKKVRAPAACCQVNDILDGGVKPVILSVGTFNGQLDDLMFGSVNPTTDIMHIKASYVSDYSDGAVLATLVSPTASEPFRSVTVKWFQIDLPLSRMGILHDRDFICLEASGILHFANGERVGYMMLHSIESPKTPPLPNVVRAKHNCTGFFRQIAPNVIDTFTFDSVEPGGNLPESVVLPVCANALLSATNYVECGLMKKLTWLMQYRRAQIRSGNIPPVPRHASCATCERDIYSGCTKRFGKDTCKLCMRGVCFACKVVKTVSFLSPDSKLLRHKIAFCATCVEYSNKMSAMEAASAQAAGFQAYNVY